VPVAGGFRDLPGAELASASLSAAGIGSTLLDAYTIGLVWSYSTALRWIRVSVADSDLEEARELLETTAVVEWPTEGAELPEERHCSTCNSTELMREYGARKTLAVAFLTIVPLWYLEVPYSL
jgi:hypothetical protein